MRSLNEPWWIDAIKALVVVNLVMGAFAYSTWLERKLLGRMQSRYGPNRAGPFGLLQPIADGIKNVIKEETLPATASRFFFILAPILVLVPSLVTFAVIPSLRRSRRRRAWWTW